jgi:hypothetical protein
MNRYDDSAIPAPFDRHEHWAVETGTTENVAVDPAAIENLTFQSVPLPSALTLVVVIAVAMIWGVLASKK